MVLGPACPCERFMPRAVWTCAIVVVVRANTLIDGLRLSPPPNARTDEHPTAVGPAGCSIGPHQLLAEKSASPLQDLVPTPFGRGVNLGRL